MKSPDSSRAATRPQRPGFTTVLTVVCLAALLGLGTWLAIGVLRDNSNPAVEQAEWSAEQHAAAVVRELRIAAANTTTPLDLKAIPETVQRAEPFACHERYIRTLGTAVEQLHTVAYISRVAGSRNASVATWKTQQDQAQASAQSLQRLFPARCAPEAPVVYTLSPAIREASEVPLHALLPLADNIVQTWTQLYIMAETDEQRDLALAGLWQVLLWEADWGPGRSPWSFPTV